MGAVCGGWGGGGAVAAWAVGLFDQEDTTPVAVVVPAAEEDDLLLFVELDVAAALLDETVEDNDWANEEPRPLDVVVDDCFLLLNDDDSVVPDMAAADNALDLKFSS